MEWVEPKNAVHIVIDNAANYVVVGALKKGKVCLEIYIGHHVQLTILI